MKSVYCAVRTGSLNKAVCVSSLKGLRVNIPATPTRSDMLVISLMLRLHNHRSSLQRACLHYTTHKNENGVHPTTVISGSTARAQPEKL